MGNTFSSICAKIRGGGNGIRHWYFTNQTDDGTYQYVTAYAKTDKVDSSKVRVFAPLQGMEGIVSGRGYIWSRSVPLLADHVLLGSGQDSFALVFPNDDYLGKAAYEYENVIITRPHSLYLQIGIQAGGIALAAYLIFLAVLMSRLLSKRKDMLAVALFTSLCGYLLMGITNDSSVTTTPVFCILAAIALSIVC